MPSPCRKSFLDEVPPDAQHFFTSRPNMRVFSLFFFLEPNRNHFPLPNSQVPLSSPCLPISNCCVRRFPLGNLPSFGPSARHLVFSTVAILWRTGSDLQGISMGRTSRKNPLFSSLSPFFFRHVQVPSSNCLHRHFSLIREQLRYEPPSEAASEFQPVFRSFVFLPPF